MVGPEGRCVNVRGMVRQRHESENAPAAFAVTSQIQLQRGHSHAGIAILHAALRPRRYSGGSPVHAAASGSARRPGRSCWPAGRAPNCRRWVRSPCVDRRWRGLDSWAGYNTHSPGRRLDAPVASANGRESRKHSGERRPLTGSTYLYGYIPGKFSAIGSLAGAPTIRECVGAAHEDSATAGKLGLR